ncbi:MAG TPA: glycine/sarcosine/betaine reductase selenoprotein B family protein [Desulfopila sp.]|nr:glycine/sarcosine/betaine reductase selenoprotein B family protein [Desulfopila sp.]
MVRLAEFEKTEKEHLLNLPCPTFESRPFVTGVKLSRARVALLSTAGLHRRSDKPFGVGESGYRLIPSDIAANDLVMSHISTNYDRTGFQQDFNMVLPLDRLKELAAEGFIGGVSRYHYSFMGATAPEHMEEEAKGLVAILQQEGVDVVLLVPV